MATVETPARIQDPWWDGAYERWLATQDVPVHSGYYVEDFRTVERGWWAMRGCPGAILNLEGHKGVTEAHILEMHETLYRRLGIIA